jgi:hypothetical protein
MSFRKVGFRKVGSLKVGSLEPGFLKVGSLKVGSLKVGSVKVGSLKPGFQKVSFLKASFLKPGARKIGALKVGKHKGGALEVGAVKVGSMKVGAIEVGLRCFVLFSPFIPNGHSGFQYVNVTLLGAPDACRKHQQNSKGALEACHNSISAGLWVLQAACNPIYQLPCRRCKMNPAASAWSAHRLTCGGNYQAESPG